MGSLLTSHTVSSYPLRVDCPDALLMHHLKHYNIKTQGPNMTMHRLLGRCSLATLATVLLAPPLSAQTVLPGIVVTTPSPITKPRTTPRQVAPTSGEATSGPVAEAPITGGLTVIDDAFVPVTVTTERELLANPGATITDTLQTKPGIAGSTFSAGANRPVIRGLDNYRVRVQENGIGAHDVSALSEDHAIPFDPNSADRVEVVRGPATLRYGSQAIGGVVAIENNRIPTFVPPRGFAGEVRGGLSSVDDGKDGAFKVTAGVAGIVVHADAFKRDTGDYDTPRGRQPNSFVNSEGFSVGSSLVGTDGFVGVSFSRFKSDYGITYDPADGPGDEGPVKIAMEQDRIQSKGEWRVRSGGIDAIRFWFGASDYAHDEVIINKNEVGTRFTNKEQEGRVEVQHQPVVTGLGVVTGAIGIQAGHRKTHAFAVEPGIEGLLDPAKTTSIAAFVFEELQLTPKLRLQAAARIEQTKVDGNGITGFDPATLDLTTPATFSTFAGERTFTPGSASLGLLYQLPHGVVARLTGQYVERAPDAAELFSKGVHEATETFEVGNPFLTKEKAATAELGFKKATGAFRFDASVYYTEFRGFIFKNKSAEPGCDVDGDCTLAPTGELFLATIEQRDATFYGTEIATQYDVAPIWRGVWGIDGQYDFVRAEFSGGGNVPRIPPHRVGGGLFYRDANWFARAGLLHAFDQNKLGFGETSTDGYTLVSAEVSYTAKLDRLSGTEFTLGVKGENLADDEVRNHVSFKKDEVLLPGANVRAFGVLRF